MISPDLLSICLQCARCSLVRTTSIAHILCPIHAPSANKIPTMNDEPTDSHAVELYIYDLTQGMARVMSQMLLGRQLDGIWHTSVVIYGREIFFGSTGIQSCVPVSSRQPAIRRPASKLLSLQSSMRSLAFLHTSAHAHAARFNKLHAMHGRASLHVCGRCCLAGVTHASAARGAAAARSLRARALQARARAHSNSGHSTFGGAMSVTKCGHR